ncbi:MAG: C4-dicarboxylate ABC transporter [Methyloprofundus sp.]|nr:C4-dicarboxylate ABC transporter [Methyloprofundus sp.]
MQSVLHNNASRFQLILLFFILTVQAIPVAQATQVLKIATISPDGTMWMKKMRAGGKEVEKRTEGRVKFKFYPGGVMGNDQSMLRKMRFKQLHGGVFSVGGLAKVYPDIHIYAMPSVFASQKEVDYVRSRMDEDLFRGLEEKGLIGFGFMGGGFTFSMSSQPQRNLNDLRRQKVWIPEGDVIAMALMKSAGISPIPLPLADVLTGLQTGMINSAAVTPVGAIAFQWYTKLPYISDIPINYYYALLAIDKKAYKKISPADQVIVRKVMTRINNEIDQLNRKDNDEAFQTLQKQGAKIVTLTPENKAEWLKVAENARQQLAKQNAFTPGMLNRMQNLVQQYRKTVK